MSPEFIKCFLLRGEGGLRLVSQIFPLILVIQLCAQSLTDYGRLKSSAYYVFVLSDL